MKKYTLKAAATLVILLLQSNGVNAQKNHTTPKPKLVVGLVVDQMRWDYLYKFQDRYGSTGFKRLLSEGYSLENVMIPYIPTVTAVGHASIYTGSVPSINGIAGNDWYDRTSLKSFYVTTDPSYKPLGTDNVKAGAHSPRVLWSTTITDQLRMATNFRSKVIAVSLKDRASILPGGHNPTGAFWYDSNTGNFITSTYYMDALPNWVQNFNSKKWGENLLAKGWNTLYPLNTYKQSTADNVSWENTLGSKPTPTFPYDNLLADYQKDRGIIRYTPYGSTITLEFAKSAVEANDLGKDDDADFLAINLASPDYIGHAFGPNSVEIEDNYLRLDKELGEFLQFLDSKVGKGNYVLFLSADHGASHTAGYLQQNKLGGGFFDENLEKGLEEELKSISNGEKLIIGLDNYQIFLDRNKIELLGLDIKMIKNKLIKYLTKDPHILYAVDLETAAESSVPEPIKSRIINGYNKERSGDIQIITKDGLLPSYVKKGTTHSVWNSYDAHIPLLFFGTGIPSGKSVIPHYMTDIAPTIAQILKIENPSGNIGNPIPEIFVK